MVMNVANHQYFSILIVSTNSYPVALFRVTHIPIGSDDPLEHLLGHCEDSAYLLDEVTQIPFILNSNGAG